jgi:hypothetical protein
MTIRQNLFIENAIQHGSAIEQGEHKKANKMHTKLFASYLEIKQDEKWQELDELVYHAGDSVKFWAAAFLLEYNNQLAVRVLKELTKSPKIIGLSASTTLDMWSKGMLEL